MSTDSNVIENRLKKDIDNLKREKQVLLGDIQVNLHENNKEITKTK